MSLQKLTLTIEKLNSSGEGLARHQGKVCFVPWGVPGDQVLVEVERSVRDYNECRILEIIEKSPDRVEPPCPYFFKCGGCQLQQMTYEAQLKWKGEIVRDALRRIARLEVPVETIIPSPKIWNYRNRIRLHADRQGKVGFYKVGSHEVVEIERCLIADEELNEKLKAKRKKQKADFELRVDESEAFSQVNEEQNRKLIELVVGFAEPKKEETLFDLFCGHGNLTFPLAIKARAVFGIEKSEVALALAARKTEDQKITNIRWIHGTVFKTLLELKKKGAVCHTMIADPPRRGLAEALEGVLLFKPQKIVSVSCDPATFARDAARLVKAGYNLKICQPLDMFPHTAHIEVLGLFERE